MFAMLLHGQQLEQEQLAGVGVFGRSSINRSINHLGSILN
jgi:hypothetical protein